MTSRERLLAAARGGEVDKVPCSPRLGQALHILYDDYTSDPVDLALKAAGSGGVNLDPHFNVPSDAPNVCRGTGEDANGLENLRIRAEEKDAGDCTLVTRIFETPAGEMREVIKVPKPGRAEYGLAPCPAHLERALKGPEDLERLRYLIPDPSDYEAGRTYHEMVERVGERGLVLVTIWSPFDYQISYLRDTADIMLDYYTQRDFFDGYTRLWFDKMMLETKAVLEAGVKAIFGCWYFTSLSTGWSPEIFREIFLPMIKQHVALVHSYDAIYDYYDDGKCMGILDMIKEARVDVIETLTPPPMGDLDLLEAKRRIGDSVCLKGYVDLLYVLLKGSPEQVERTVKEAVEIAGPRGFILGTCDSVREKTPRENLHAYFEAARKHGKVG